MSPFSGDLIASPNDLPVYDQTAAHARAQNDSEYDSAMRCGTIGRLREGKAVGIVLHAHFASEPPRKVSVERLAIENRRVGVLDEAGAGGDGPGGRDAD